MVVANFTKGNNPATTRNPYNGLLGFVSVAALMGFSKTLRFVGDITTGNANELGSGIYFYNVNLGSLTNNPGGNFGFIICIANTTMKLQIGGWAGGDSGLKCRNWYSGGTWSAWRDI